MLKVFLIWIAVLAVSFCLLALDVKRDPNGKSFWTGVFMWTLILGVLFMLTQCLGGGGDGSDCTYGRTGVRC
jgi:uncharacterized membrane protein YhaH (DUF805 family)